MTITLRILLACVSLITLIFVTKKVRDSKIKLEDSLFWFIFAVLLLIVSIFPQIFEALASIAGVYSTSNFVFLFFIFVLLIKCFTLTLRVSQLDTKVKEIAQQLAIEKKREECSQEIVCSPHWRNTTTRSQQ